MLQIKKSRFDAVFACQHDHLYSDDLSDLLEYIDNLPKQENKEVPEMLVDTLSKFLMSIFPDWMIICWGKLSEHNAILAIAIHQHMIQDGIYKNKNVGWRMAKWLTVVNEFVTKENEEINHEN